MCPEATVWTKVVFATASTTDNKETPFEFKQCSRTLSHHVLASGAPGLE